MNTSPSPNPEPAPPPAEPTQAPPRPPAQTAGPEPDDTVKETIESIVIAFILAFVFRAFIVEPFIIPTGSMAPTMLGAHLQLNCPSCGYGFDVGVDSSMAAEGTSLQEPVSADCPMCNYEVVADIGTKVRSGDRILVDKFSYHLTEPSRWDVVVFKAPKGGFIPPASGEPAPRTNFIKRLIGLPGERVCLFEGNVYISPAGTDDFTIARKTDPQANGHWQKIQRTAWQPIYHSQYVPIESGLASGPGRDTTHVWRVPWRAESGAWELGTALRPSRVYRFKGGGDGEIRFDFEGAGGDTNFEAQNNKFPYNQFANAIRDNGPMEDIRLACAMTPGKGEAQLRLSTTARLDKPANGIERLIAQVSTDGLASLFAETEGGEARELARAVPIGKLKPGIAVEVELWLVDDEASVWVNGERVIVKRFDLDWEQIAERPDPRDLPEVSIKVSSDDAVEFRRIELDRDIYYFADRYPSSSYARAEARRLDGTISTGPTPLDLNTQSAEHDAEYFVLGDNQPASEDGRGWNSVDGWVQLRYFDGKERSGVVPRSLLVGRAFMVYYPAPHGSSPHAKGIFPDFGRMRFVH